MKTEELEVFKTMASLALVCGLLFAVNALLTAGASP